ncbi:hypothetical protein BDV96DRAFT_635421 [Lophiotrema nucula]|uniref:DUF1446-domain-containing protein n=1 Tax=Lophiotrema nucula TaxID=690887 RepID=A0A6A5YTG6_9PLEO|nr:hypothetical protein BDV96DRAFT_635421 [Lophiotrema nucula]
MLRRNSRDSAYGSASSSPERKPAVRAELPCVTEEHPLAKYYPHHGHRFKSCQVPKRRLSEPVLSDRLRGHIDSTFPETEEGNPNYRDPVFWYRPTDRSREYGESARLNSTFSIDSPTILGFQDTLNQTNGSHDTVDTHRSSRASHSSLVRDLLRKRRAWRVRERALRDKNRSNRVSVSFPGSLTTGFAPLPSVSIPSTDHSYVSRGTQHNGIYANGALSNGVPATIVPPGHSYSSVVQQEPVHEFTSSYDTPEAASGPSNAAPFVPPAVASLPIPIEYERSHSRPIPPPSETSTVSTPSWFSIPLPSSPTPSESASATQAEPSRTLETPALRNEKLSCLGTINDQTLRTITNQAIKALNNPAVRSYAARRQKTLCSYVEREYIAPKSKKMTDRRPIRIGNASGAIGDGIDQVYRLARDGRVDAITADYLAEFNIAWKAVELQTRPELGYEPNFLDQLAWQDGAAAKMLAWKKIKVVHDGGALNPEGLARKTDEYFKSLGIYDMKVSWVSGDDVTGLVKDGKLGQLMHLDRKGVELGELRHKILAANVYTGMTGIIAALEAGADIVICGRCCDASPVMGLAAWWHHWKSTDYQELAGSLLAGHIIECGAYATGGNYCGWREINELHHVGYPIAEIEADGSCIITKPEHSNGAVTIDTCKAQLLYEIQGPYYLNPDVIARIDGARLEEVGRDRVRLTGIKGSAPPPESKLAICITGGWQAEIAAYCAGLDTKEKFALMKDQVMREIDLADFTTFSMEVYGSSPADPKTQQECTVMLRMFAQSENKDALQKFRRAIFYNGMQGYCGLHLGMDWRTMEPKEYVKYFPSLVPSVGVPLTVHLVDSSKSSIAVPAKKKAECAHSVPLQPMYEPQNPTSLDTFGPTVQRPLGDLVFARSGDKGGNANIGLWVRHPSAWPWLHSFLTTNKVIELLGDDWKSTFSVERCEFENLMAVHFVIKNMLQEGVSSSSILDGFGKSVGEFVRARFVNLPQKLVDEEQRRRNKMGRL